LGKGDKRTKKGKIDRGTFGNSRKRASKLRRAAADKKKATKPEKKSEGKAKAAPAPASNA
jgi:ribosomal small subunit protein bTHX